MELNVKLLTKEEVVINERVPYTINNNVLSYKIGEMLHTLDFINELFIRENEEYAFTLNIKEKTSEIRLKKEEYILQVKVEYANLLTEKKEINLKYLIETDDNEMHLIIELEGEIE